MELPDYETATTRGLEARSSSDLLLVEMTKDQLENLPTGGFLEIVGMERKPPKTGDKFLWGGGGDPYTVIWSDNTGSLLKTPSGGKYWSGLQKFRDKGPFTRCP